MLSAVIGRHLLHFLYVLSKALHSDKLPLSAPTTGLAPLLGAKRALSAMIDSTNLCCQERRFCASEYFPNAVGVARLVAGRSQKMMAPLGTEADEYNITRCSDPSKEENPSAPSFVACIPL